MEKATATLNTSLGVIAPGEDVPVGLPRKEHLFLRASGGTAGDYEVADKAATAFAKKAVQDAEKALADAKSDTDKQKAAALVGEANARLSELTGG